MFTYSVPSPKKLSLCVDREFWRAIARDSKEEGETRRQALKEVVRLNEEISLMQ